MSEDPDAPRDDAAPPAWYPHPRREGALRYWNGVGWIDTDASLGWYPDPSDRRVLRFWDGTAWGEVLADDPSAPDPLPAASTAPAPAPAPASTDPDPDPIYDLAPNPRLARDDASTPSRAWVTSVVAVACLVAGLVIGGVVTSTFLTDTFLTDGDDEAPRATATVTATATATGTAGEDGLTIRKVLSSRTLSLETGEERLEVRLLGLGDTTCDTNKAGKKLLKQVVDQQDDAEAVVSTVTDPVTGEVGAYVEVDDQDLGELLIGAGLATAAVGHPRAAAYDEAQAGATPFCAASPAPAP